MIEFRYILQQWMLRLSISNRAWQQLSQWGVLPTWLQPITRRVRR
ncbi:hypothetical protein [uncultured Allofournierella sp.]